MTRLSETDKRFKSKPSDDRECALDYAEKHIQRILLELSEVTGKRIDHVNVDTRNFANCGVEIFLSDK